MSLSPSRYWMLNSQDSYKCIFDRNTDSDVSCRNDQTALETLHFNWPENIKPNISYYYKNTNIFVTNRVRLP